MLRAARSAPSLLADATGDVVEFVRGLFNPDGGVKNRSGESDLYYTVFALDSLGGLGVDPPERSVRSFLRRFHDGTGLDFVHRACLARCWSALPCEEGEVRREGRLLASLEACRSGDGGYADQGDAELGSLYHAFLALGAYQDLNQQVPGQERLADFVESMQTADGGFANEASLGIATTPTTAAGAVLLTALRRPVHGRVADWLLARCDDEGGFRAAAGAPLTDLLSTAVALHALSVMGLSVTEKRRAACIDFTMGLRSEAGGFRGHEADDAADAEYTFYALLALGHLSDT